jgi:hypothetical protein
VNQSLVAVRDVDEGAEWDRLGDLSVRLLTHRMAVGECLEGVGLRRSQGQSGLRIQ